MVDKRRNVVIVGAGVIGVSAATVFSRAGHRVTVVESAGGPATGVTSLGSGGFRHTFPDAEETRLAASTLATWNALEREHGISFGFHRTGYLLLATGAHDPASLERRAAHLRDVGVEHRLLDAAEVRALMPGFRGDDLDRHSPEAALFTPTDAYTSPPAVVRELARLGADRGVRFRYGRRAVEVLSEAGSVRGVWIEAADGTEGERLEADLVINAAGLRAPEVGRLVGDELPVTAWRQHQFRSNDLPGAGPDDFPCVYDDGDSLYFRPDGAGVLIGYHDDAEAWAEDYTPNDEMRERCLDALAHRWPALAEAGVRRHWVGCYEVTPDHRALVGVSEGLEGSAYLCGFSGHGLMNSLGAAEELRRLIDGEQTTIDPSVLSAARFATA